MGSSIGIRASKNNLIGLFIGFAVLCIYIQTLAPGVWGFDSAEFASGVYSLGIVHPPGYPLYTLAGKLFSLSIPIRDIAYRLNLMSALFGAGTVLCLYFVVLHIVKDYKIAASAAVFFAFTNYYWQLALIAEVYTLHTFLLCLELLLIFRWRNKGETLSLYLFAFVFGLSLSNHTSSILFLPGFTYLIVTSPKWNWKHWSQYIKLTLLFTIGLSPYIYLPIRAASNPSINYVADYYDVDLTTIRGIWWMVSGQAYKFFAFGYKLHEIPQEITKFLGYFWRNFLGLGIIIGLLGAFYTIKRDSKLIVGLALLLLSNALFFINYRVLDKDTMFLPVYIIWTIFLGLGLKSFFTLFEKKFFHEVLDKKFIQLGARFLLTTLPLMALFLNWRWVDMSQAHGPSIFAKHVFNTAEPDSLIIAEWSSAVVLEYFQVVLNQRPDLDILNRSRSDVAYYYKDWKSGLTPEVIFDRMSRRNLDLIKNEINFRTVYTIEYDPVFEKEYEYLPEGDYFRLVPK